MMAVKRSISQDKKHESKNGLNKKKLTKMCLIVVMTLLAKCFQLFLL